MRQRVEFMDQEQAIKKFFLILLIVMFQLACSDRKPANDAKPASAVGLANQYGVEISEPKFRAYLKFKRMDKANPAQQERLVEGYAQRQKLADAIAKSDVLDQDLLEAELEEFRREMLISRYFAKYLDQKVTDDAVKNFYVANQADYKHDRAKARHILVRIEQNLSEPERQAKQTAIQEAYSQLQTGKSFAEVAETYSEDKVSARKGGDLGWLKRGAIHPDFSAALFKLEPGKHSLPVETPFGFHIVYLEQAPEAVTQPLETVKGDIRYKLRAEAKNAERKRLLGGVE